MSQKLKDKKERAKSLVPHNICENCGSKFIDNPHSDRYCYNCYNEDREIVEDHE